MGIEVPPPRGGPADFSDQSEFVSKSALNPGEETATEVGDDNDRNDEVSICLSEGSSQGIWQCSSYCAYIFNLCSVHALDSLLYAFEYVWKCLTVASYVPWLCWGYRLVSSFISVWVLLIFLSQSLQKPFFIRPVFLPDSSEVNYQVRNLLEQLRDEQRVQTYRSHFLKELGSKKNALC